MHMLGLFLIMNHQCKVTNHLKLNSSPSVVPNQIQLILPAHFLNIRLILTCQLKVVVTSVHISLSVPTNIFMYSSSFPTLDSWSLASCTISEILPQITSKFHEMFGFPRTMRIRCMLSHYSQLMQCCLNIQRNLSLFDTHILRSYCWQTQQIIFIKPQKKRELETYITLMAYMNILREHNFFLSFISDQKALYDCFL